MPGGSGIPGGGSGMPGGGMGIPGLRNRCQSLDEDLLQKSYNARRTVVLALMMTVRRQSQHKQISRASVAHFLACKLSKRT